MTKKLLLAGLSVLLMTSCGDLLKNGLEAAGLMHDSEEGLILYYPFDGNLQDRSGNGYDGTPSGAIFYTRVADRFGVDNSTVGAGNPGHVDTGWGAGFNPVDAFSINFWIWYPNAVIEPGLKYLLGVGSSTYPPVGIRFYLSKNDDDGELEFLMTSTGLTSDEDSITFAGLWATLQDADWHMIAVVHQDGTGADKLSLYLDGVEQTPSGERSGFNATLFDGSVYLLAARQLAGAAGLSNTQYAALDDFRLYNRAIDQIEIDALYREGGFGN